MQARFVSARRSARIGAVSSGARWAANPRERTSAQRAQSGSGGSLPIRPSRAASSRARTATASIDGPPHRHRIERFGQRVESNLDGLDPCPRIARHRTPFDALRGTGERIGRVVHRKFEIRGEHIEIRCIGRVRPHRRNGVARELEELAARDLHPEEPGRDVRNPMRFIDDQGVGEREQFREPLLLESHVREQKVVVGHDHIRLGRPAACLDDVASVEHRTLRPQAVVRRGGDGSPHRVALGKVRHLRKVAGRGPGGPSGKTRHPRRHLPRHQPSGRQRLLVAPAAEVVRSALEQGHPRVAPDGTAHERQIAFEQPILEVAGTRRNHGPSTAGDGGYEVRERLAGAGPGLADEDVALRDGALDRRGHGLLRGTRRVAGQQLRQRAARGEHPIACGCGAHLPRPAATCSKRTPGKRLKGRSGRGVLVAAPSTPPRTLLSRGTDAGV